MSDRNQDITKFSFFSYRALKKTLGEFDAVVECNELAIREFIDRKNNDDDYIQKLSIKHSIRVNSFAVAKFNARIRQYYLLSVMQQFESFTQDFRREWIKYYPNYNWDNKNSDETPLEWTLRNIKLTIPIPNELLQAHNYYRLVRNYMAHTDRDHAKIDKLHDTLSKLDSPIIPLCACQAIPSPLDQIEFGDFILATNIVKSIAYLLSSGSKPTNMRIAELLYEQAQSSNTSTIHGISKLRRDEVRFFNAIDNFAVTTFGRFSEHDLEEVRNEFIRLLA